MRHTEKVSVLDELKSLATRGNLEVLGISLTLGIYKLVVNSWNSANVGQEIYDFFRYARNTICRFYFYQRRKNTFRKSPNN